jgi:hypothetical protein
LAFESTFAGGVYVAAADLDGDGKAELVVTPDEGGGPVVAIFNGTGGELGRFFGIDDPNFRGGARATFGDLNGDGTPDLVVAAGFGGGPRVAVYNGRSLFNSPQRLMQDFFAFESQLRNGAFVAMGDLNGDGADDLVLGAGPGGAPRVRVLNGPDLLAGRERSLASFFAGNEDDRAGVRVTTRSIPGSPLDELITGPATGNGIASVYRIRPNGSEVKVGEIDELAAMAGGIFVG